MQSRIRLIILLAPACAHTFRPFRCSGRPGDILINNFRLLIRKMHYRQLHTRVVQPHASQASTSDDGACLPTEEPTVDGETIAVLYGPLTPSELILPARKIEFESCQHLETRSDSELSQKNGGIIRPKGIFFRNILG